VSKLWLKLRLNEVAFKTSDGSIIHAPPDALSKALDETFVDSASLAPNSLRRAVVIELPTGVEWLHKATGDEDSRMLFVRQASFDLVGLISAHYRKKKAGVVVMCASHLPLFCQWLIVDSSGTPGIGKSWLANLLLLWASQENNKINVIFESVQKDVLYIFEAGQDDVVRIGRPRMRDYWPFQDDPNTLYIFDAGGKREPLDIEAFTVCLSSPNEQQYGQFAKKDTVEMLMMPPWEWDEVAAIAPFAAASFPDVAPAKVLNILDQRYSEVGGVLRTLFAGEDKYLNKVSAMKAALTALSDEQIRLIQLKDQQWQFMPNDLFVLRPAPPAYDWRSCSVDLASDSLKKQLPNAPQGARVDALIRNIATTVQSR